MISSYLKIALRNLFKRKGYSLLNILGLAIGITCCLLIFQYVSYERSYDKFQDHSNSIVRLRLDSYQQGKLSWQSATIYPAIAPTMKKDFPEVEDFCRLHDAELLLSNDERNIKFAETKGYYADPSFIKMFNVQLTEGSPSNVLDGPDKMIMSETMAKKYFGSDEPVGKRLVVRDQERRQVYEVTGVFKEYRKNSHLIVDYLVSYATMGKLARLWGDTTNSTETSWGWYDFYSYLQLKPGSDYKKLEAKLPAFCNLYMNNREWSKTNNVQNWLYLIPLSDIHLYSNYNQEAEVNGNGRAVGFMFLIGFFIMGIAWINYINLATARSVERAREVGVRKVLGAVRASLIRQFLVESFILNLLALLIGMIAAYMISPSFNTLMGREQSLQFSMLPEYALIFGSMFIAGTLLSGLYPALVLSAFQPVKVLKGLFKNTASGLILRKSLIIFQFGISVILIAGTIIVYQQVRFMQNQKLGFNPEQNLVLDGANSIQDTLYQNVFQPFKSQVLQVSGVKSITASSNVMGKEIYWTSGFSRLPSQGSMVTLYRMGVDYDFIPQFEMKLVAGRNFSKEFQTDNKAAILNEKAVGLLGFESPQKAIGQKIRGGGPDTLTVIGVVQSFHHLGLQKPIDPEIFHLTPGIRGAYTIKLASSNMQQSITSIQGIWNKYFPNDPYKYYFLDEYYGAQYKADKQFGKVFGLFAFLAILIACFGLIGLSSYNILQRTKEIGIRKVMGASVQNVLFILSKDFLLLVFVAFLFAIPVAWWVMYQWLQDFAYRIDIQWWVFMLAGMLSTLIAVVTIGLQAIKAALANPVKSLRTE